MSQVFHRSMNSVAKISIVGGALLAATLLLTLDLAIRSPLVTNQEVAQPQPVQFSHKHHYSGLGIHCLYCHTSVEDSSFANVPPTATCMNCHSQVWYTAPILQPVRTSFKENQALEWNRVHNLADFAYFNHSIHVNKGIGCVSCHGRIDQMQLAFKAQPMTMEWCISCHKNPEPNLRPRDQIYNFEYKRTDASEGPKLMKEYKIRSARMLTSCSTCHR